MTLVYNGLVLDGWRLDSTGGGCTALRRDLSGGAYALLTDGNQTAPAGDAPTLMLGFYTAADLYAGCHEGDLASCLAWLEKRIAATVRTVDLDQETGEPHRYDNPRVGSWEGSWLDFMEGNAEDGETCEKVCALDVGGTVDIGGGAGVLTRVTLIGGAT